MSNLKLVLRPTKPTQRSLMEIDTPLGADLHKIYLEDSGGGVVECNYVLNGGYLPTTTDWDDSNADGLANDWEDRSTGSITHSIVDSIHGLDGRAQKLYGTGTIKLVSNDFNIITALNAVYKIRFVVAMDDAWGANNLFVSQLAARDGSITQLIFATAIGGGAQAYEMIWQSNYSGFYGIQFQMTNQGFEMDEVKVCLRDNYK